MGRRTVSLPASLATTSRQFHYRTVEIDGIKLFYREAGRSNAPVVVLLHGFPTSSNMFRNLIPVLADRYRVIAPDYPGFGQSEAPDLQHFRYSFARFAELIDVLLTHIGARSYALYVMDYGAPVGYRLAIKHPERVTALVVQNGNAYVEGLKEFWDPIKRYWVSGSREHRDNLRDGTTLESTRRQYIDGVQDVSRTDPTVWLHDQALLDRSGVVDIQLDLFYDYRTNIELYPSFQEVFRERTTGADCLGQERQDLPGRRRISLPARPSARGAASAGYRSLRARGPRRSDRPSDARFPRSECVAGVTRRQRPARSFKAHRLALWDQTIDADELDLACSAMGPCA
jgi:pimeloyl-ACP methyl ester carboxylesterase